MTPSMPPPGLKPKPELKIDTPSMEGSFACPSCGAQLRVESAGESNAEHAAMDEMEPEE
jgi:competence CoiA-like predicted nuclease